MFEVQFDVFCWILSENMILMKCLRVELNTLVVLLLEPKQINARLYKTVTIYIESLRA